MTSAQFEVGDLIRERNPPWLFNRGLEDAIWRVVEVGQDRVCLIVKCDDRPGITRVILRLDGYEKVEVPA